MRNKALLFIFFLTACSHTSSVNRVETIYERHGVYRVLTEDGDSGVYKLMDGKCPNNYMVQKAESKINEDTVFYKEYTVICLAKKGN